MRKAKATSFTLKLTALTHPIRIQIIDCLMSGPKIASQIAKAIHRNQVNTSHHLQFLRKAELVTLRANGRNIIYSLNDKAIRLQCGIAVIEAGHCKIKIGMSPANTDLREDV